MEHCQSKLYLSDATKFWIAIDEYKYMDIGGQWYCVCKKDKEIFRGFFELYQQVNRYFDNYGLVQKTSVHREFSGLSKQTSAKNKKTQEVEKLMDGKAFEAISGEKATFMVQILYRQNATWQGTVKWIETNEETNFRSAMELMHIMDGALKSKEELKEDK